MSQNVAFIGLGIMGLPMAKNLVNAGFNVTGYNRSPEKGAALEASGGHAAKTVAEAGVEQTLERYNLTTTPPVCASHQATCLWVLSLSSMAARSVLGRANARGSPGLSSWRLMTPVKASTRGGASSRMPASTGRQASAKTRVASRRV